jgi:hypothetical protein
MKKLLLGATALSLVWMGSAKADTFIDPLQGVCSGACIDNGQFTPIVQAQADTQFGFRIDPAGQIDSLKLVFLVPNTITAPATISLDELNPTTLAVTAALSATSAGTWTSASGLTLSQFLGLGSITPSNPFSAFQVGADTGVSAFNVFTVDVNTSSLGTICNCDTPGDRFKLLSLFAAAGVDIVGFATLPGGSIVGTAPSGQLQISTASAVPGPVVGAGLPGLIAACVTLIGLAKRRRNKLVV